MKKILFLAIMFILNTMVAQTFEVETIYNSGDDERRINLVILSDGYTESELPQFILDATSFTDELFVQSPFLEYKDYFNVYAIKVPSNESGADHPGTATDVNEPVFPVANVDNFFGSTFDFANIHRLLVPTNGGAINSVLANNFPLYDQVLILVNSPHYGGSGGQYATTSLDAAANEIAIHELGHSFSSLKDEYYAGDGFAGEDINMTQETDPSLVRWSNWIGTGGVGVFQHCCGGNSATWFRPHENCKMRVLGPPFCPVCVEGTIERIHSLVSPIDSFLPTATSISTSGATVDIDFELDLIEPVPLNTLTTNWMLNGTSIDTDVNAVSLDETDLNIGANELMVFVEDITDLLRVDNHSTLHLYSVQWEIEYDPELGIVDAEGVTTNLEITMFPNPVTNKFTISFDHPFQENFKAELYTIEGKLVKEGTVTNENEIEMDITDFNAGVYILKYYLNDTVVSSQQIIKN